MLPKKAAGRGSRYGTSVYDTSSKAAPKSGGFIGRAFIKVNLAQASGILRLKAGGFA